ncbi:MAG: hypothetical protein LBH00_00560 [Planctomycetaceae bacterium]|nr:hypothetical protein [Planctomycetaceae bacterium]
MLIFLLIVSALPVAAIVIGFITSILNRKKGGVCVVKEWNVSKQAMPDGNFVKLVGRQAGLIAYLATLAGIDPTVTMTVDKCNFSLVVRTFFGFTKRVIPLAKISETQCGFAFPWIAPLIFALIALQEFVSMFYHLFGKYGSGFPVFVACGVCFIFFAGLAVWWYIYKRLMLIGVWGTGGGIAAVLFRPSFIEGKRIDLSAAEEVTEIIRLLVDRYNTLSRQSNPSPPAVPSSVSVPPLNNS